MFLIKPWNFHDFSELKIKRLCLRCKPHRSSLPYVYWCLHILFSFHDLPFSRIVIVIYSILTKKTDGWSEKLNLMNQLVMSSTSIYLIKSWLYSTKCSYGKQTFDHCLTLKHLILSTKRLKLNSLSWHKCTGPIG